MTESGEKSVNNLIAHHFYWVRHKSINSIWKPAAYTASEWNGKPIEYFYQVMDEYGEVAKNFEIGPELIPPTASNIAITEAQKELAEASMAITDIAGLMIFDEDRWGRAQKAYRDLAKKKRARGTRQC